MADGTEDDSEARTSTSDLQGDSLQRVSSCLEVQALCACSGKTTRMQQISDFANMRLA